MIKNMQKSGVDDEPRLCDVMNEVNSAETIEDVFKALENYVINLCTYMGIDPPELRVENLDDVARPVRAIYDDSAIVIDCRYLEFLYEEYEYYSRNVRRYIDKVSREFSQGFLYNIHYKPRNMWEDAIISYVASFSSSLRPLGACIGNIVIDNVTNSCLRRSILRFVKIARSDRDLVDTLFSLNYMICDLVPMIFSEPFARIVIIDPRVMMLDEFYRCLRNLTIRPLFEIVEMIVHEINGHVMDKADAVLDLLKALLRLKSRLVKML
ncbi:MAG: hypothetical protein GXO10_04105 [Crenarchaeota archaeon]|nr:hypothetical protein [Thermoproteota archaeon]